MVEVDLMKDASVGGERLTNYLIRSKKAVSRGLRPSFKFFFLLILTLMTILTSQQRDQVPILFNRRVRFLPYLVWLALIVRTVKVDKRKIPGHEKVRLGKRRIKRTAFFLP